MSRINDDLQRLKKNAPPPAPENSPPPFRPIMGKESSPIFEWLIPAIIIFLIITSFFFIGWACAHHTIHSIASQTSISDSDTQSETGLILPIVAPMPTSPPAVIVPELPKLQGIFYSATAPTAILDGKNVRPGDQFNHYRVKQITKYTVTLTDPAGKEFKLGMGN
jgi:hypothetical protein